MTIHPINDNTVEQATITWFNKLASGKLPAPLA